MHNVCGVDCDSNLVLSTHLVSSCFLSNLLQSDETFTRSNERILDEGCEMSQASCEGCDMSCDEEKSDETSLPG